ncbi:MAG: metal-sulfur cluster assembly factor [Candidatus Magasanikbacteria bacterium]
MITREEVIEKLKTVLDPDIGIDVWTLGFIYEINIKENDAEIVMTLTTPLCHLQSFLKEEVENAVRELGFGTVFVRITFDPPWKLPEKVRNMMGV